jgi:YidC/Oxa1 family membrane protein insertase
MKRMQILQPEMKALQEKYKDDPTRQQKELMELYRKHKVNPMSGCLPMIIQMPIFFSLYQVLGKVIELRGAPFYGWITDLSKPDTIMVVMGISINILPLLMGVTMWVQQKMTTTPDPKSAMMGQMMTLVFIFIFWNMPSGLVLYWFITNILSILQQHYINKQEIPIHMPHAEAS